MKLSRCWSIVPGSGTLRGLLLIDNDRRLFLWDYCLEIWKDVLVLCCKSERFVFCKKGMLLYVLDWSHCCHVSFLRNAINNVAICMYSGSWKRLANRVAQKLRSVFLYWVLRRYMYVNVWRYINRRGVCLLAKCILEVVAQLSISRDDMVVFFRIERCADVAYEWQQFSFS